MKEKAAAREAALKLTTGIAEIAVDAVQVSVDPCAVRVVAGSLQSRASSLPAHHSAASAGGSPVGGSLLARLRLKADRVTVRFSRAPKAGHTRWRRIAEPIGAALVIYALNKCVTR